MPSLRELWYTWAVNFWGKKAQFLLGKRTRRVLLALFVGLLVWQSVPTVPVKAEEVSYQAEDIELTPVTEDAYPLPFVEEPSGEHAANCGLFYADSLEEAQTIAEGYGATLASFEDGMGMLMDIPPQPEESIMLLSLEEETADFTPLPALYPNYIYHISEAVPSDPTCQMQWHLDAVDAYDAWDFSKGKGVIVAVLDTGGTECLDVNTSNNLRLFSTCLSDNNNGIDDNSHGTHVISTIASMIDGQLGCGVAPEVMIYSYKVLNKTGYGTTRDIASAINQAIVSGADVINMSFGGGEEDNDTLLQAAIKRAYDADVVCVAAMGNEYGMYVCYPAKFDTVIAVGALERTETGYGRADYSNYGEWINVCAPGSGVVANYLDKGVQGMNGTSMATPCVSAIAALIRAIRPDASVATVREILQRSANDLGEPGFDIFYGHGMINAHQAAYMTASLDVPDAFPSKVVSLSDPYYELDGAMVDNAAYQPVKFGAREIRYALDSAATAESPLADGLTLSLVGQTPGSTVTVNLISGLNGVYGVQESFSLHILPEGTYLEASCISSDIARVMLDREVLPETGTITAIVAFYTGDGQMLDVKTVDLDADATGELLLNVPAGTVSMKAFLCGDMAQAIPISNASQASIT